MVMRQVELSYHLGIAHFEVSLENQREQERVYGALWQDLGLVERQKIMDKVFAKNEKEVLADYAKAVEVGFDWLPAIFL